MSRSWVSSALVCSSTVIVNGVGNHDDDAFQCVDVLFGKDQRCSTFCDACASLNCNGLSDIEGIDADCSELKQNCHLLNNKCNNDIQIVPLSYLDFEAYLGRWYQTYVSLSAPFQIGTTCVTADYGIASDGKTVTVKNKSLYNDPSVGFLSVEGYAPRNPNGSGELQVELGRPGQPVTKIPEWNENPSNYIVAAVGPIVEGLYDYAIVGDLAGTILYVLARDVGRFEEQHKEKVLQQTQDLGFTDDSNRPRKTIQEGCSYPEVDEVAVIVNGLGNHADDAAQCVQYLTHASNHHASDTCNTFCDACGHQGPGMQWDFGLDCKGLSSIEGIDAFCAEFRRDCYGYCYSTKPETVQI